MPLEISFKTMTRFDCSMSESTILIPSISIIFAVSLMPAVSINFTVIFPIIICSSKKSLVVPGISLTMALFLLIRLLNNVDLPELG